jgi:hypothetical protein
MHFLPHDMWDTGISWLLPYTSSVSTHLSSPCHPFYFFSFAASKIAFSSLFLVSNNIITSIFKVSPHFLAFHKFFHRYEQSLTKCLIQLLLLPVVSLLIIHLITFTIFNFFKLSRNRIHHRHLKILIIILLFLPVYLILCSSGISCASEVTKNFV